MNEETLPRTNLLCLIISGFLALEIDNVTYFAGVNHQMLSAPAENATHLQYGL